MGTPVPVRDIVEAKKSEIETKLLQLAAEYVVFNPESAEKIIKEAAKIKLSLYVAYTASLEKEIDLDCSPTQVSVTNVVYVGPYFLIAAISPSGRRLSLYVRGFWNFEIPDDMVSRLEAERSNIREIVEKIAAALIQKNQDIASSLDSIREAEKLIADLSAENNSLENEIKSIEWKIDDLYEEIEIAERFLRERGLWEEFEDYYDEKRGEEDEGDC